MDYLLITIYTSLPFIVVVLLAVLAVAGIGLGAVWPRFLVYPYLAIYFWMNSTTYGSLSIWSSPGVYTRGSGVLYFSLILWYVLGAWCCARVSATFHRFEAPPCNLRPWFLGWLLLLAAHAAAGLFSGVDLKSSLATSGFANVVWMAPLISLMLLSFRTRADATQLAHFIMLAGLCRAVFGLVRWLAFGGDPNNVYENLNNVHIKLTFFDINDSLVCTIAFAIAAVNLFQTRKTERPRMWVLLEWATVAATAVCVVLSYRRTAWIGFLLAFLVIMMRFPMRQRVRLLVLGLPVVGSAVAYAAYKRLSQTKGAGGGLSSLVHDMRSQRFGAESDRVLELKLAFADFLEHFVTGIGSWGRYAGYEQVSWQAANPDGGLFLHSGVLHIALKTGLPGLLLFTGTAMAFILLARRALRELPPEHLGLATAGVAGVAFMLPDMLVGTPIPQIRTTQMLAVCLALPYVAMAVTGLARRAPVRTRAPLRLKPVAA